MIKASSSFDSYFNCFLQGDVTCQLEKVRVHDHINALFRFYCFGVSTDHDKVKAVRDWPTSTTIQGSHGLTALYRNLLKDSVSL